MRGRELNQVPEKGYDRDIVAPHAGGKLKQGKVHQSDSGINRLCWSMVFGETFLPIQQTQASH